LSTSSDGTIAVKRVWKKFRRDRSKPYLSDQIRALGQRVTASREDRWRWVLRDIDFLVEPGEALAIVGSNGAGKSTLLKILTRVMYPTAGSIQIDGRVGSIIELRGGMHPDLSGRENTFMYGTLLGLQRQEIRQRFDSIVNFAEVRQAIDRPMKYYSSGMQMRLGFAIAAFLRPSVLLVDEVLAVGDAWFQQRCLDRMREVLSEGTTLVLVSHDLASVEATCTRGLWLRDGVLVEDGPIRGVLGSYRKSVEDVSISSYQAPNSTVSLVSCDVQAVDRDFPISHEDIDIVLTLDAHESMRGRLHVGISEGSATPMLLVSTPIILEQERMEIRCRMHNVPLPRGRYSVWIYLENAHDDGILPWHPVASFVLAGTDLDPAPTAVVRLSPVHVRAEWDRQTAPLPATT
jgi:ABC-type polysaccharide/polyol phosphate transport system ATPase subunit